ncbi:monooxygenase, partial [Streptomyces katrae]
TTAMGYCYPRGAVVGGDPDRPIIPETMRLKGDVGTRAPHMWLTRAGQRVSLLDLYETSFVLLSSPGTPWKEAAGQVARELGAHLDAYTIGSAPDADLVQPDGADWAELHELAADGAVLVRPDGFVAWRAEHTPADPRGELLDAMTRLLRRA